MNIKKYTKDQMAKMVEDAQESAKTAAAYEATWRNQVKNLESQVSALKQRNAALTEQISQMNGDAINKANVIANLKADADALRNKLADTEAALGRANALCAQFQSNFTLASETCYNATQRANYAEAHPWRNLWEWAKRKLVRQD